MVELTPEQHLSQVRAADAAGNPPRLLLFWGHQQFDPGCLSQWWPEPFTVDGVTYPTAEHWMMAGKARLFGDSAGLAAVLASGSPGAAKAAGRKVRGFDEARWVAARYGIVVAGNLAKFRSDPKSGDYLLNTGKRVLVEASPFDRIWGIGLGPDHQDASRPSAWRGLNLLGFALMEVRERLRQDR